MTFGLLESGFSAKRLADLKLELEAEYRTRFGANVRLTPESVNGQMIAIIGERLAELWELAERVYGASYRDTATGTSLNNVVALAGLTRRPATYSTVTLTITGTPTTVIPIGRVVSASDTGSRVATTAEATIGGGGTVDVAAQAEETGPISFTAGTLTEIETPVAGWTSVTNALDADIGRDIETAAALRLRQAQAVRQGEGCSADTIRAALLRLDDVEEVLVIENEGWQTNSLGMPPKSFQAVVREGDDQEIVDAIWAGKPVGIETFGTETGTAVDVVGGEHEILWSRPDEIEVWIEIDIEASGDFPDNGIGEVLTAVLAYGQGLRTGESVLAWRILRRIETEGIDTIAIRIGRTAGPPNDDPITMLPTELALIDSSRVTITRTN